MLYYNIFSRSVMQQNNKFLKVLSIANLNIGGVGFFSGAQVV